MLGACVAMRLKKHQEPSEFAAAGSFERYIAGYQVGLGRWSICNGGAVGAGNDLLDGGFIDGGDRRGVKRATVDKLEEGILNVLERDGLVEVVAIDGCHGGGHRRKHQ